MTMPAEDEVKSAVRSLLGAGWQVRPNPIINNIRAVQLSLIYPHEGVRYVDVVTLSYNAPSIILHCVASYDPDFPFDHNAIWERWMSATAALDYALDLNKFLRQPAAADAAEPAQQHQGDAERHAPDWFFEGRNTLTEGDQ